MGRTSDRSLCLNWWYGREIFLYIAFYMVVHVCIIHQQVPVCIVIGPFKY